VSDLDRAPVIIGTGQVNDRSEDLAQALDAGSLMLEALAKAVADAGGKAVAQFDTLEMVRLFSAPMNGIVERLAAAYPGLRSAPQFVIGHGNTPMLLLNRAAQRIARGEADICAITGAEAYRTEKRLATRAAGSAGRPDMMKKNLKAITDETNLKYGAITPIEIYPFFENAMRAHWGQTLEQAQTESAKIWSDFSHVAAANPHAWIQRAYSPAEILATNPANRKLNFPYSTLMVANNSVNQGAAIMLASYAKAKELGIADDKIIFVGAGTAANESHDFRERSNYFSSPSLQATIHAVLKRNRLEAARCEHVELYSCFPCVPKHARREANFRTDIPLTVSGGLTFAGGPIRNYMMHATAAMTDKLRQSGNRGILFGNGGYLTEAHAIALSRTPIEGAPLSESFDVQEDADARRGDVPPFVNEYLGSGRIETYTVTHSREGEPLFGTIIGRGRSGERFICRADAEDADMMRFLMSGEVEPVGARGEVVQGRDGFRVWQVQ
jgi:acetyl-CoA C-acetyltransferase